MWNSTHTKIECGSNLQWGEANTSLTIFKPLKIHEEVRSELTDTKSITINNLYNKGIYRNKEPTSKIS